MKVIYGIGKVKKVFKNVVLAIGVFDGLHLGHQELIKRAIKRAKDIKGKVFVMTFSPHPVHVLHPNVHLPFIVSVPYRLKLIKNLGVAACVVVHFTKRFSHLSPQKFIKKYLVEHINPKEVFVGDDFRFGENRSGTLDFFREAGRKYGFNINAVHPVVNGGVSKISSTTIRELITQGKLASAKKLLGRPVAIMGKVVKGDSRGRSLGFPTANIHPENEVIPPFGAYAVNVQVGAKMYPAMANIGYRPSFKSAHKKANVEVHLFDFNRNLYDKEIVVQFIKRIRNEKLFPTKEKLIDQLQRDEVKARKILL